MGRTLHFEVDTPLEEITEEQKERIYALSVAMNSDVYEKVWTCENFFIDPWNWYPNWKNPKLEELRGKEPGPYELINKEFDKLQAEGKKYGESAKILEKKGLIYFDSIKPGKMWGFVKVGGNEFNAFLVYQSLLIMSCIIPNSVISLYDEGEFLRCNVLIKNGKVKPDLEDIKDTLRHWKEENQKGTFWAKEDYIVEGIKFMEKAMKEKPDYGNPSLYCRKVNLDDFKDYPEYNSGQIMAGFHGEYFGLTDKDAEQESYKATSNLMNLLKKAGFDKNDIQVTPKISK